MSAHATVNLLTLLGFGGYFSIYFFLGQRFKRKVNSLFAKHHGDLIEGAVEEMQASLNREFPQLLFSPGRTANVAFRGQQIFLVYGPIGRFGLGKNPWIVTKCVYAIAPVDRSDWMKRNSDAFTLAYSGTSANVYWAKLSAFSE
jgi:hypothetical protein